MEAAQQQPAAHTPVLAITGARTGLGRYLAEHYLRRGWRVWGCSRSASDLSDPGYRHTCLDVSDERAVSAWMRTLRREAGGLTALINNAGLASMNAALLTPGSTARRLLEVNTLGSFLCAREAAKAMARTGGGRIVNFTTVAVPLALEGEALYVASKAAVEALTGVLARELAPSAITVNALGPTPIDTGLLRGVPADKIEALLARQPLPEKGRPAEVAHICDFFLHPDSRCVTGQVLYLGGVRAC